MNTIAILGAGNGGCAMAAEFTFAGKEVRLWGRREETLRPSWEQGGVRAKGVIGEGLARVSLITTDIGQAIRGAELVIVVTPISAHEPILEQAAPHMEPGQLLLLTPGHEVLLAPSILRRAGVEGVLYAETASLPYATRKTESGTVSVYHKVPRMLLTAFPAPRAEEVCQRLAECFPGLYPGRNLLQTAIMFSNSVHHPPGMVCNAGWIEFTRGDFLFYNEGITPAVGRVADSLDAERVALGKALDVPVQTFADYFLEIGYTTPEAAAEGSVHRMMQESAPNRQIRAPQSLDHRYVNEDIAYGLVPLSELGRLAGVPTPTMDALVHLASIQRGIDFRAQGLTLEKMGLRGVERAELDALLEHGFPPLKEGA